MVTDLGPVPGEHGGEDPFGWLDALLNYVQPRSWSVSKNQPPPMWSRAVTGPEYVKNLVIYRELIARAMSQQGDVAKTVLERFSPPDDKPMCFKVLLACRFALENYLIAAGDRTYIATRLAGLYSEEKGTYSTWRSMYGDARPAILRGPDSENPRETSAIDDLDETRERMAILMATKQAQDVGFRHHAEYRARAAHRVTWVLLMVAAAFASVVYFTISPRGVLLPALVGGIMGAALGSLVSLRNKVRLMSDVRQFNSFFGGQLVIGGISGMAAFLLTQASFLTMKEPAAVIMLGVVLGFSEAAFIGILGRFTASAAPVPAGTERPQP